MITEDGDRGEGIGEFRNSRNRRKTRGNNGINGMGKEKNKKEPHKRSEKIFSSFL